MLVFVVKVCQGDSVEDATPIIVTSAPSVVRAVGEAIARELGADAAGPRVLELLRGTEPAK